MQVLDDDDLVEPVPPLAPRGIRVLVPHDLGSMRQVHDKVEWILIETAEEGFRVFVQSRGVPHERLPVQRIKVR